MNRSEFAAYKNRFVEASRTVLAGGGSDALSEAALPAYANPNPAASYLFWKRVRTAIEVLERRSPMKAVLDFGCGGGVMLPLLDRVAERVVGTDIDLGPFEILKPLLDFPSGVEVIDASERRLDTLPASSFDAVTALDVLEHVDDLPETISSLCRLLRPGGLLLVSGPTENLFYRLGRKISGKEYTGHYHVRNIYQIREVMAQFTSVRTEATLFYPVPLFKIYAGVVGETSA